ncbi:polyprenyl synthetase family protein [Crassaminicella thermophila]|uniref:Polyprenyl synthetase family protein n=1 Tax=Crassaminicella thermophila TaxID=2599308 RepID=A0A5C0S8N4_CRATE|nr:polyprenyl synthetase family protein [Crassaminicella thermophila]QEK10893.1 polyprenyl synthetase family protein [Crassaminicella thermophila]
MSKVIVKEKTQREMFHVKNINGLKEVEEKLLKEILDVNGDIYKICLRLIKSGGKRIRPILVLCSSQCFGELTKEAIQTAAAYEFIHMASLVHDDIIDESFVRRNKPTVNALEGNQVSVLVGDYLFAKAFEILSTNRSIKSMSIAVKAIQQMCDGEIVQADNKFNLNQTIENYYERIYKKTGILIASCCQAGAIIGGADKVQVEALKAYGKNLGYAFQIIDDLLDFTGNEESLGKPVGCDLREGNITLPILKLINQSIYKDRLKKMFKKGITVESYYEILYLLKENNALEEAYDEAVYCIKKAKDALEIIEDSMYKRMLLDIADKVLVRKN